MALARTNQSNTVALPSDVIVAHICILKGVENVLYLNESNSCRLWYCRFIRIGITILLKQNYDRGRISVV